MRDRAPQHHMVIIMFFWEQFIQDQCLSKCINGLKLLYIPNILNGNRADPAVTFSSTALFLERVFKFGRCTDCFLFQRPNSSPPFILRVLKIRFPFFSLVTTRETFKACRKGTSENVNLQMTNIKLEHLKNMQGSYILCQQNWLM